MEGGRGVVEGGGGRGVVEGGGGGGVVFLGVSWGSWVGRGCFLGEVRGGTMFFGLTGCVGGFQLFFFFRFTFCLNSGGYRWGGSCDTC